MKREPETFAVVPVPLPDFRNERCVGTDTRKLIRKRMEVHVAFANLQAFPIDTARVGDMQMRRMRSRGLDKIVERAAEMVTRELGVADIETEP